LRRNQVFGIVIGLIGGWMTGNFWPAIPAMLGWGGVLLWGATIGAMIGSLAQFERAGKILTRSDHRILNTAVALCVPLLIVLVLYGIVQLLRR
jgi:hypothetical protein